jgi:predicted AAA+ superfamily ATPase
VQLAATKAFVKIGPGLRQACITRTGEDLGKALECAVYLKLRSRFQEVYYWRGDGEIDFVVEHGGRATPIQVSWPPS